MEKKIFMLLSIVLFGSFQLKAQTDWEVGGNTLSGDREFGSKNNYDVIFKTNNIERGRMTRGGRWGFGALVNPASPAATVHINSPAATDPFRVQVAGNTKLWVNSNGGVAVGDNVVPAANGLYVSGNITAKGGQVSFGTVETLTDAGSNTISSNSNLIPTSSNIRNLGDASHTWNKLYYNGGIIGMSDERLKKNIRTLNYGLKQIMQLRAVEYNFINDNLEQEHLGVIAQEIQKVLPEVVVDYDIQTNEKTGMPEKVPAPYLGVKYLDIIPVLIRGMQEQQQQIDELKKTVEKLSQGQSVTTTSKINESTKTNVILTNSSLEQNRPNPLNKTTSINYSVPTDAKNAQLIITDNFGKTVKQITLSTGKGVVNIDAAALGSGTYNYTLLIDGRSVENKRMIVAH